MNGRFGRDPFLTFSSGAPIAMSSSVGNKRSAHVAWLTFLSRTLRCLLGAILYGDAMDNQNMSVIARFPKNFNIGMIPDTKTQFATNADDEVTQEQVKAEQAKWKGELDLFKVYLKWIGNSLRSLRWAPVPCMISWMA